MWRHSLVTLLLILAPAVAVAQGITIPNTFVNGTAADATAVNANFSALANSALNRTAGTMTGTLTTVDVVPTADNVSTMGLVGTRYANVFSATFTGGGSGLTAIPMAALSAGDLPSGTTLNSGVIAIAGKQTLWIPATAMAPSVTNGASGATTAELTSGRPNITSLSYVNGADKFAEFAVAFPKSWNAGTITFQPFWTGTAAGAGTTIWGLACVASADGVAIDNAYGTAVTVSDAFQSVKLLHVAAESAAVTIASAAADSQVSCRIYRSGSTDTRAAASLLLGVKLYFTTNAKNDQ